MSLDLDVDVTAVGVKILTAYRSPLDDAWIHAWMEACMHGWINAACVKSKYNRDGSKTHFVPICRAVQCNNRPTVGVLHEIKPSVFDK